MVYTEFKDCSVDIEEVFQENIDGFDEDDVWDAVWAWGLEGFQSASRFFDASAGEVFQAWERGRVVKVGRD